MTSRMSVPAYTRQLRIGATNQYSIYGRDGEVLIAPGSKITEFVKQQLLSSGAVEVYVHPIDVVKVIAIE